MSAVISAAAVAAALGQFPPTAEQTAVIESPPGPALVVAGAGSGKTETMAARVVWLVANSLVRRDEVLGLTFTRKAAGELAERVQTRLRRLHDFEQHGLLPALGRLHADGALAPLFALERARDDGAEPGAAIDVQRARLIERLARTHGGPAAAAPEVDTLLHRPTVSTYNSFADAIMREHAVRIGRDAEAAVLSESAAWLLMRRVVHASDDPRLEHRGEAPRTIIDAALRIARDGTDNLVDLDALAAFPAQFADVLLRPSSTTATTVYKDVQDAVRRVEGLALLADLARAYAAEKRRLGVLDYADQVAGALQAVRADPAVGAELRDRYRVVLLDEYQDTSVLQTDLLAALFAGTPVMAVGDPHQAIYGWRGASAGNLGGFSAAFDAGRGCARFTLATSWRNSTRVLDAANAVLDPSTATVAVQRLRPRPQAPAGSVEALFTRDLDAEADGVAGWFDAVRTERARAGLGTSGALLFRGKRHMVRFADALAARGIPHRILGLGGLLGTPEVVDVVSTLRVICDPTAGSALLRLLGGPRWAIGLADLRQLGVLARRMTAGEQGSLIDALDFVLRHPPEHDWLADFTATAIARLREAGGVFDRLRRASGLPVPELVRLIEAELRLDIELAANETRGPARTAAAQLRAFVDELHAFLATDESGSLPSLLAWLDHAERLDQLAPRTEPPEQDVVQLLTIHGAKGLEWDAVAVVRMVADELPAAPKGTKGWLDFGVLPYQLRGDRAWLPQLAWQRAEAPTQQDLKAAIDRFVAANRAKALEEETRLCYVAVTRARERLLLSGASWAGTKRARGVSPLLAQIADALQLELPPDDPGSNPYSGRGSVLSWPMDPLGARRAAVIGAAGAVERARAARAVEAEPDLRLLLAERTRLLAPTQGRAPGRLPASRYHDFATDYARAADAARRPVPERPFERTRVGTLFHAWVEHRSGVRGDGGSLDDGLWELDDADDASATSVRDQERLQELKAAFERSEWAALRPIAVETQLEFTDRTLDGTERVIVCRLDAVYRRAGRIEIVDWKTGSPPTTAAQRAERMLQLQLYRRAYHERHGVPLTQIDVALFYVGDGVVLRG